MLFEIVYKRLYCELKLYHSPVAVFVSLFVPLQDPFRVVVSGDNISFHFYPSYSSTVDPFNFSVGMIEPKSVLKLLQWWKESIVTVKFERII